MKKKMALMIDHSGEAYSIDKPSLLHVIWHSTLDLNKPMLQHCQYTLMIMKMKMMLKMSRGRN